MKFLIIFGVMMIGAMIPEFIMLYAKDKHDVPIGQNIFFSIGSGLIIAGIIYW